MSETNRQYRLKSRPQGRVTKENFELVEEALAPLAAGAVRCKNLYLSLDPTNRIWMTDVDQYMPPVQLGEVMRGGGLGRVVESNDAAYKVGDIVVGMTNWQTYCTFDPAGQYAPKVIPGNLPVPLSIFLGPAGMTGLTAYFGLLDIGQPQAGETLVVSAAAGAVGSIVGQIGKLKGMRVVGIAGGADKCRWLKEELGFDEAVDYKAPGWQDALVAACPRGVDINFENVGGEVMQKVLSLLNLNARVVLCGLISGYNDFDPTKVQVNLVPLLMKRVRLQGFIVMDFASRYAQAAAEIVQWIVQGKIKYRETVVDGLDSAPEALNMLFDGKNVGKLIVKIAE